MVITVEPGCYFNEFTLRPALQDATLAHLLVPERIEALLVRLHQCAFVSACLVILTLVSHICWCCFTPERALPHLCTCKCQS